VTPLRAISPGARAAALLALGGGPGACAPADGAEAARSAGSPEYLGVETRLLDTDLVQFLLTARGDAGPAAMAAYGRCAAAQYAVIRGMGYARHIRTTTRADGGILRGDAVYTLSAARPAGESVVEAAAELAECRAQGIPAV